MPHVFDAQSAMGFLTSQRAHIETAVNMEPLPDIQYKNLIPVDTTAGPFAKTVDYYSGQMHGQADWVNGNAGDINIAGVTQAKHTTSVYMAGIGYSYGYEELTVARSMGVNLPNGDAMAARRISEEFVDNVSMNGDASKGLQGLVSHTSVTAAAVTTGDWDTATESQILGDINNLLLAQSTATNHVALADTLLLPVAKYNKLATTVRSGTDTTLLELIKKSNTYTALTGQPLTIRAVRGLETAGAGGVNRMVAYRRSPEVLKFHMPMPHQFLPVWQAGPLSFMVPGVMRLGGLDIRRPKEVRYGDGI